MGGAARFQIVANHYRLHPRYANQPGLITLFSGDAFNPSLESSVTKGRHMVPILNDLKTDAACVGVSMPPISSVGLKQSTLYLTMFRAQNHDLDFGVPQFRHLRNQCNFPWLLANVLDPALGEGKSLADCPQTIMLTSSNGIRVGLVGLAEREWYG